MNLTGRGHRRGDLEAGCSSWRWCSLDAYGSGEAARVRVLRGQLVVGVGERVGVAGIGAGESAGLRLVAAHGGSLDCASLQRQHGDSPSEAMPAPTPGRGAEKLRLLLR